MNEHAINIGRRGFLKTSAAVTLVAGSGLTLGVCLPATGQTPAAPAAPQNPNVFVRVGRDNTVTVISKHVEMGQGSYTGLATLVAEELDAAWSQIRVEGAPANAKLYANLEWGTAQGTGGSSAIANSFEQMRTAGATARAMLVAAAAQQWNVPAASIAVKNGVVSGGGKTATFGQLADAAASQPVPSSVKLKDAKDFVLIGKSAPRVDARAKSNGTAQFTLDVKLPDMLTAVVAHPPRFGAKVKSFDGQSVSGVPGVRYVVQVPNGVAVVATGFWAAKKGRDALKVEWDESAAIKFSSADILAEYKSLAAKPGKVARNEGDAAKAYADSAKKFEAAFEYPFLAHAAMEPMDCVVKLSKDGCEIWNGEQFQTGDQYVVSQILGMKPEQVKLNMLFAGGSFGRRANPAGDYIAEAVSIAKALAESGKYDIPMEFRWSWFRWAGPPWSWPSPCS
jgi:isoquinoline 1-oxidoreductase beta subunit